MATDSGATARLRKTFAYPDSDDDSEPSDLDEQEQEELIKQFVEGDAKKTEGYKRAFLVLPLLSIILYLPYISSSTLLPHLLAITSLLSSAYMVWITPSREHAVSEAESSKRSIFSQTPEASRDSPLKRWIAHLNAGLCILLSLVAIQAKRREMDNELWLALLPVMIFGVVFVAKTQLKPVDVKGLEGMKYGLKGA